jgi:hypothetical protein
LPILAAAAICLLEPPGRSSCLEKNTPTPEAFIVNDMRDYLLLPNLTISVWVIIIIQDFDKEFQAV